MLTHKDPEVQVMLELLESQRDHVMGLVAAQTKQILELKATSNSTTNLIENKITKMHLFPNPASDNVKIHTNQPSEISFLAITGNLITQFSVNGEMNFDVSQFPQGIYLFQINDGEIIRFIKN